MAAMCRKCLKTASDEARRCAACGGRVVRFTETGEVLRLDAVADEPSVSRGVPALFAELDAPQVQAIPSPSAARTLAASPTPAATQYTQPQTAGLPSMNAVQPPHGYCQPGQSNLQPAAVQTAGYSHTLNGAEFANSVNGSGSGSNGGSEDHGLAPPLPMGYTYTDTASASASGGGHTVAPPAPRSGTFILPLTQLDDVVSEMLSPFGFEDRQPVAQPQAPTPIQAPPPQVAIPKAPPPQVAIPQAPRKSSRKPPVLRRC